MATLGYTVILGIPPTECRLATDEPAVLVGFMRFLLDMTEESQAFFLNVVTKVNPEWLQMAKNITKACFGVVGVPS